jgi:serine/threonine protein kinase
MNEVDQLKRFSGLGHEHLVTLLATFTFQGRYYLLFPYADCALDQYWESQEPAPTWSHTTVQWIAKQCQGLMAATDFIHEPRLLQLDTPRFGRHGDIKPENVLWFQCFDDPRGILVLSDLGLSSFNRDTSRSNIPNSKIPGTPGYRPPECDIEGGTVSRAYDIWTLGCLFLELLTWMLGGNDFVQEFQEHRTSMYITGSENDMFFAIKMIGGNNPGHVAQIKEEVTEVSFLIPFALENTKDPFSGSTSFITIPTAASSSRKFLTSLKPR